MIAHLKPYPEYRESGVSWLGPVPRHWEIHRLRTSITDCVNGVWGTDPNGKDDLVCVRVADFDRVNLRVSLNKQTLRAIPLRARTRRLLQRGDLLLEKSGGGDLQSVGAVVVYDHDARAVCSNFVARMPVAHGYNAFFVNYLHFTLYANRVNLRSIKQTTGIQNLDGKEYLSERVAFPPPPEQEAIVRFLDWANGRLGRAIRTKRKVIALLNEQKEAIIHRTVTRGLDPSVPLKPSGIPWLGDIPRHWDAPLNQRIFKEDIRPHNGSLETQLSLSQRDGLIATRDMRERSLQTASYDNWKVTVPGDLVLNRFKAHLGVFFAATLRGIVSFHYGVFAPLRKLHTKYFELLFHTYPYRAIYAGCSNGMTVGLQNLSNQSFYNVRSVVPPLQEQVAIAEYAERETKTVSTAMSRLEREIELLREYRTRLVADVVTGRLDVREAAARLPEETAGGTTEHDTDLSDETEPADEDVAV